MAEIKRLSTELQVKDKLLDTSGDAGTSGQILSSTGTGTNWINVTTTDSTKVAKAGDTMTGNLTISKTSPAITLNNTAGGGLDPILRSVGTNFKIDTTSITALSLALDTGNATFAGDLTVTGTDIRTGASNGLNLGDDSSIVSIGRTNELWTQNDTNADATLYVNYRGYSAGSSRFRSLDIRDGKAGQIAVFSGTDKMTTLQGGLTVNYGGSSRLSISGDVAVVGATDFAVPQGRKLLLDGAGGHTYIEEESDSNLKFYVAGNERMNITSGTTYSQQLELTSGNQFTINNNASNNYNGIHIKNDTDAYSGAVTFWTEYGGTDTNVARVHGGTNGSNGILYLQVANTSKTLTTALALDYNLNATFAGDIIATHANTPMVKLIDTTNDLQARFRVANAYAYLSVDNSNSVGSSRLVFQVDGAEALHLDGSQNATFAGDVTVGGNLNITGDINSVSVTDLDVTDKTITIAKGAADSAAADGAGIVVDGASASILYDHTGTQWEFNKNVEIKGDVILGDGKYIYFGDNPDLKIYHNGSHSFIQDVGAGDLRLLGSVVKIQNTSETDWITCFGNIVELKNAGNVKLATTGGGVDITGALAVGAINMTGTLDISATYPRINLNDTNHEDDWSIINDDGHFKIYNVDDNVDAFKISATNNATFAGNITVTGGTLNLGNDVSIYDDGANILRTDDVLHANGHIHVGGASGGGYIYNRSDTSNYIGFSSNAIAFSQNATFAGVLKGPDGSGSAPTYSFSGRTDTGMWAQAHSSNDRIMFNVDGTNRAYIDSNGITTGGNSYASGFRNYSGVWAGTTGTAGNGFYFLNTAGGNTTKAMELSSGGNATFAGKISSAHIKYCNTAISNSYVRVYYAAANTSQLATAVRLTGTSHGTAHVSNFTADIIVNHYQDVYIRSQSGAYTQVTLKVASNNNGDYTLFVKSASGNSATYYFKIEAISDNVDITTLPSSTSSTNTEHEHTTVFGSHETGEGGTLQHKYGGDAIFAGLITANSPSSAQLQVSGWSDSNGANNANGSIYLGNTAAYRGVIDYDAASSGSLIISNTWNNDAGNIVFKTKTAGTDVIPLTLSGSGNATFTGNVDSQGYTINESTLHSFHDFQSRPIDADSGMFTVGGHGMASGYSRAISIWSTTNGVWRSWVGTNLRWDGTNYKRASNAGNNNWGNIAGILFTGDSSATGTGMKFIIDPPENASGSGEATIGTSLPSGYTALSINNDLSVAFAGELTIPGYINHAGDSGTAIGFDANDVIRLKTASSTAMQIDSSQNIKVVAGQLLISGDNANFATLEEHHDGAFDITTVSDFTIDSAGDITLDAAGSDINLKADGTNFGRFTRNNDNFHITATRQDGDIKFYGNDGGSSITALTLDMSSGGTATFNNELYIPNYIAHVNDADTKIGFNTDDNVEIRVGGNLQISASASRAYLRYQGSNKIQTDSAGVDVTGNITVTGVVTDRNIPCLFNSNWLDGTSSSIYLVPFNNHDSEKTVSARTYFNNLTMPSAGKVAKVVMKNVSGSPSSSFTTQLFLYVNGSQVASSSELTIASDKITWSPTSSNTFSAGDELSFGYQKSASNKTWSGVSMGIIVELTDYDI